MVLGDSLPTINIPIGSFVLIILIAVLLALLIWQRLNEHRDDWSKLPGPVCYPFLGNLEIIPYAKRLQMHEYLIDMMQAYGDTMRLSVGTM